MSVRIPLYISAVVVFALSSAGSAFGFAPLPIDTPPIDTPKQDVTFTGTDGQKMRWQRVAPGYAAFSIDQRTPDGPIVFAGVPNTMDGLFDTQMCEAVGCYVYRMNADGSNVEQLFSEYDGKNDGFGFMRVAISDDGHRVAAAAIDTFNQGGGSYTTPTKQGRAWLWRDGKITTRTVTEQMLAVVTGRKGSGKGGASTASSKNNSFLAAGGSGLALKTSKSKWRKTSPGPTCAYYDIDTNGPRVLMAGWSGTYKLDKRGKAHKIGPSSSYVWSDGSNKTVAINLVSGSGSDLAITSDGGRNWRKQKLVDNIGQGDCDGKPCNDGGEGARLSFDEINGSASDDLWAFGVRADTPGGRVYHYTGNDTWERVAFPAEIYSASGAVVLERGRPLVATGEGMWRAVPESAS